VTPTRTARHKQNLNGRENQLASQGARRRERGRKCSDPTHWAFSTCLIILLCSLCLCLGFQDLHAEGPIRLISSKAEAHFSERLAFSLEAESDAEIVSVILRYRRGSSPLTTRVRPTYQPGKRITVQYVKDLERGEIAPGTQITYTWHLADASGNQLNTPPQTLLYVDDRFNWKALSKPPINLYWYSGDSPEETRKREERARHLLNLAHATLKRLQEEMGITLQDEEHVSNLPSTVEIYVYNSSEDMRLAISPKSDEYDARIITLGMLASENTLLLLGSHRDVEKTLAHELSHLVVGAMTRNPYADLPRWLDEGLAMYAEGELPENNARALERAIRRDTLLSVRSLSGYTGDPTQVDLFYGEAYSVVDFLLTRYGEEKMSALLQTFRQGIDQEDALQRVYGFGLDELDAQWRESLGLKPRPTISPTPASVEREAQKEGERPEPAASGCCLNLILPLSILVAPFVLQLARLGINRF